MENEQKKDRHYLIKSLFKNIVLSLVLLAAACFAAHLIFQEIPYCSITTYTRISLIFAFGAVLFSLVFLGSSFSPEMMRQVAKFYPDPEGRGEWHAVQSSRLGAVSNLGYASVMLACGWMRSSGNGQAWEYFAIFFGAGVFVIMACKLILWKRHPIYRPVFLRVYATASGLFAVFSTIFLVIWSKYFFFFDFTAFVIIFVTSIISAGLVVSPREEIQHLQADIK
jgi:hypothetical protein